MQTAAPWQGGQTIAGWKQSLEPTNLLLQLVAATLFHREIAYGQNLGTHIHQHCSQPLHGNAQGCSHPLNFYDLSLSVPPARHRPGAVSLLDCPLWAPVPIRGRSGSITPSTAGSQPCLPACPPVSFPHTTGFRYFSIKKACKKLQSLKKEKVRWKAQRPCTRWQKPKGKKKQPLSN